MLVFSILEPPEREILANLVATCIDVFRGRLITFLVLGVRLGACVVRCTKLDVGLGEISRDSICTSVVGVS